MTHDEIPARIRRTDNGHPGCAAAAEEARTLPRETIDALLSAGIARISSRRRSEVMALASRLGSKWCAKSARQTHRMLGVPA